jgi:addiction module RelB/DinJ family antitoxin
MRPEVIKMAQISIRMDDTLREQTDLILSELGLSISSAVNIFARQL